MPATLAYPLDAILMIALPVGLGIWLERKFHLGWGLWWIGAATFIFSQAGHIPFNIGLTALFKRGILPTPPVAWLPAFNATFLGLSAGLWEELARYAAYRWWAKEARSWRRGVMLGAGHGGIEAILGGILVLVGFVNMMAIRNVDLSSLVPLSSWQWLNRLSPAFGLPRGMLSCWVHWSEHLPCLSRLLSACWSYRAL
jgi:uncharacterized membrane protein YhfC